MHTNTPKKKTQNKKWWIAAHPEAQWQTCQDKKKICQKKNQVDSGAPGSKVANMPRQKKNTNMPKKKSGG
jgi:hypothetical protein